MKMIHQSNLHGIDIGMRVSTSALGTFQTLAEIYSSTIIGRFFNSLKLTNPVLPIKIIRNLIIQSGGGVFFELSKLAFHIVFITSSNFIEVRPFAAFALANFNKIIEFSHRHTETVSLMKKRKSVFVCDRLNNWNIVMPSKGIKCAQRKVQTKQEKGCADKNIFR